MRIRFLVTFVALTFLALTAAQVFAIQGAYGPTLPTPIIFSSGAPALSGDLMSGVVVVAYADYPGSLPLSPPLVTYSHTTLRLCGTAGCTDVIANFTDAGPATGYTRPGMENYVYSFVVPSTLTGLVTITVPSNTLIDDYARHFPALDTEIGSFTVPSAAPPSSSSVPSIPGSPSDTTQPSELYKVAPQIESQTPNQSLSHNLPVMLVVLAMVACGLILTRRH